MIITYENSYFKTEQLTFDILNEKLCFLKGQTKDMNHTEYFGIYQTSDGFIIATIGDRSINFEWWENSNGYTDGYIKKFLSNHSKNEVVSEEMFFKKLDYIKNLL